MSGVSAQAPAPQPEPVTLLRVFHVGGDTPLELPATPESLPATGFLWLACHHSMLDSGLPALQAALHRWCGGALLELHVSDLRNASLPSRHEDTSWYDLMVFRRLAAAAGPSAAGMQVAAALPAIDTTPVGFVVFDRVLVSVHHADCTVREHFAQRLLGQSGVTDARVAAKLPASPADLMLRMINHMVDQYLELRRQLTRQFGELQRELLDPRSRFDDWHALLASRETLALLEDICEDHHTALDEWIDALEEWPLEAEKAARRERELLRARSRDVREHIERVLGHVRRLGESAEAAVQMHFSALGHRTNDIMRTLTVLTAIFLPLNLITGIFGMNFDSLPLIHSGIGLWITLGSMAALGVGLVALFRRKRYLRMK